MKPIISILFLLIIFCCQGMLAQKKVHHPHNKTVKVVHTKQPHRHNKRVVVVKRIPPPWAPHLVLKRRWLYYPRYNFYYDCIKLRYVYYANGAWLKVSTPPPIIVNVKLSEEQHIELNANDQVEEPEKDNALHKQGILD